MTAFYALGGGIAVTLAFMDNKSDLHPHRWWVMAFGVLAGIGLFFEFRAIRWMDRAGMWEC
jgi:hypothetical protein